MEVQGTGFVSPLFKNSKKDKRVIVEGIVTLERQGSHALNREIFTEEQRNAPSKDPEYSGFWLQQPNGNNTDLKTFLNTDKASRGIFIFHTRHRVKTGQVIRLLGQVNEYQTLTEIKHVDALRVCHDIHTSQSIEQSRSAKLISQSIPIIPVPLKLPVTSLKEFERLEGMRVQLSQSLVVSDLYGAGYGLGNYGQFAISSKLQYQPTELISAAEALKNPTVLSKREMDYLLVDDGTATLYPRYIPFPNKQGFSAGNSLRIGDTLKAGTIGVLHAYKQHYILIPEIDLLDKKVNGNNTRSELNIFPAVWNSFPVINSRSNFVVASMNLGNYFNGNPTLIPIATPVTKPLNPPAFSFTTMNRNKGFPTERGAKTYSGFKLQREKIVTVLRKINADIITVMELENDGYSEESAIADLTRALNKTLKLELHYKYVIPNKKYLTNGQLGRSSISVGILYRHNKVNLVNGVKVLNSKMSKKLHLETFFNDRLNRPSLIQEFEVESEKVIIAVNHFKSKGTRCKPANRHKNKSKKLSKKQEQIDQLQGNCNQVRKDAASALNHFLEQGFDTAKDKILILGDLNSYSQEDPLLFFYNKGYTNLNNTNLNITKSTQKQLPEQGFSYSYQGYLGNLDHALANPQLLPKVRSFHAWHINSVEDVLLDYSTEGNGHEPPSIDHYGTSDEKRSSDHDPLIIGIEL
jgi:predicted extracellular nuclease